MKITVTGFLSPPHLRGGTRPYGDSNVWDFHTEGAGLTEFPPRLVLIVIFLGLTEWLTMARIIRGQVLVLKQQPFVQSSLALGQSHGQILWKHLLPNLLGLIVIYLTLTVQ